MSKENFFPRPAFGLDKIKPPDKGFVDQITQLGRRRVNKLTSVLGIAGATLAGLGLGLSQCSTETATTEAVKKDDLAKDPRPRVDTDLRGVHESQAKAQQKLSSLLGDYHDYDEGAENKKFSQQNFSHQAVLVESNDRDAVGKQEIINKALFLKDHIIDKIFAIKQFFADGQKRDQILKDLEINLQEFDDLIIQLIQDKNFLKAINEVGYFNRLLDVYFMGPNKGEEFSIVGQVIEGNDLLFEQALRQAKENGDWAGLASFLNICQAENFKKYAEIFNEVDWVSILHASLDFFQEDNNITFSSITEKFEFLPDTAREAAMNQLFPEILDAIEQKAKNIKQGDDIYDHWHSEFFRSYLELEKILNNMGTGLAPDNREAAQDLIFRLAQNMMDAEIAKHQTAEYFLHKLALQFNLGKAPTMVFDQRFIKMMIDRDADSIPSFANGIMSDYISSKNPPQSYEKNVLDFLHLLPADIVKPLADDLKEQLGYEKGEKSDREKIRKIEGLLNNLS
ncbi:hypothetical protein COX22_01895 [Candidatus Falkowbacteria bacterium CG23_combo_of_CG06-09_8_20_14_all_49_15]|uniref:Uncharacterized protein n=1 Tax=Candidatus Falkowbacteria bacterium CG23_combo_of_CG06-09_8_20_14_all_49_15 TaxID=1974572 RepID=A0A2G9ZLC6_9BACT|nr:MAG: hypothetical protein COX22_01895 [Candidatus Falkowbacteria bacterium CG23_combo_of_CG06-09_8_20_14_all_49_15]